MTYEQNRRDLAEKMAKDRSSAKDILPWDMLSIGSKEGRIKDMLPLADIALRFAAERAEKALHTGRYAMSGYKADEHLTTHGLKQ